MHNEVADQLEDAGTQTTVLLAVGDAARVFDGMYIYLYI